MNKATRREFDIQPVSGHSSRIGTYLAELDDLLRRLKEDVTGLSVEELDWTPAAELNSIATLLIHIAATEVDWIQETVLGREVTAEELEIYKYGYPWHFKIPPIAREPVEFYLNHLDAARTDTKKALASFKDKDLKKRFSLEWDRSRVVTLRWVLYHLVEHFAHHRGQILYIRHVQRAIGGKTRAKPAR